VPFTSAVNRCVSVEAIWSDCAWVIVPAVTAVASSVFSAATSAATSPAVDFPLVASATCARVLPACS
jgi:hypothetical protein